MFKAILTIGTIQTLAVFIQFLRSKIAAVYLGPAGVGVTGTIDQFVQFAAFLLTIGIPESSIKFLSRSHGEGIKEFKKTYAGFFKLLLLLSIAGMILTVGLISLRADIFGEELAQYRSYLFLALGTIPFVVFAIFFVKVFAAADQPNASSIFSVVVNTVTTTAIGVGVITGGIFGFYLGSVAAGVVLIIGTIVYLKTRLDLSIFESDAGIWKEIRRSPQIVSLSIYQYFGFISNSFSYLVARYAILRGYGETEAGLLHALIVLSMVVGLILTPIVKIYFAPIVNRNIETAEKMLRAADFQRLMIIFTALAALPIVLFPKIILTVLFSPKFTGIGDVVYIFVIAQVVFVLAHLNQVLLIGTDDLKSYAVTTVGGQLLFALLSIIFAPYLGIEGVAAGHLIASSLMFLTTTVRLRAKHGFRVSIGSLALLGYALAALTAAGLLNNQIAEWQIQTILLKTAFFFLIAAGFFLFLNAAEKESLGAARRKFFFR